MIASFAKGTIELINPEYIFDSMVYRDHAKLLAWRKKYNLSRRAKKIKLKCVVCSAAYETTEGFRHKSMFCSRKCKAKHFGSSAAGKKLKAQNTRRYYLKNKEAILEKLRFRLAIDENYKLKRKKINQEYRKTPKGRAMRRASFNKGRAAIKQATPKWNDHDKIKKIYEYAKKIEINLNKNNSGKYANVHVDHIIPIHGKTFEGGYPVCGLNVWYNLMPSLETDNTSKQNFCPPEKQLRNTKIPHISLDKLPTPNKWIKFIESIHKHSIKSKHLMSNYIELNPRNIK